MIIVGGIYQERCISNGWDYIFGSAGRAAAVLSGPPKQRVSLYGWYYNRELLSVAASFAPYGIDLRVRPCADRSVFEYFHPLSDPRVQSKYRKLWTEKDVINGDIVLLFGALEGFPGVRARKLVIDPQGSSIFAIVESDSIVADKLIIVANEQEIAAEAGNLKAAVRKLFSLKKSIVAIVVKRGVLGARVFLRNSTRVVDVAPYRSSRIFKIGSGDVFSAAFAQAWASQSAGVAQAADFASRSVACYVEDPSLNFTLDRIASRKPMKLKRSESQIYLAAPFFTLSEIMLLAEARRSLRKLGARVFSPLHDVGVGKEVSIIANKDLRGLIKSNAVFAMLEKNDPGTIFEIGFAKSHDIPVIIFAEHAHAHDLTMFLGTGCEVESDFCTALYKSMWASLGAS